MAGNHVPRASPPACVLDMLLGKEKFAVGCSNVTLPAGNQSSVINLSRILNIVDNSGDCGSDSTPFANVQQHQPRGCHIVHLRKKLPVNDMYPVS